MATSGSPRTAATGSGALQRGGKVTEFRRGITRGNNPQGIAAGPDGNLWFTEDFGGVGRITPTGTVTEFTEGISPNGGPVGIATGPDGNLWFTENRGDRIGRITPTGDVTEFTAGISGSSNPVGIVRRSRWKRLVHGGGWQNRAYYSDR
jgi:virginiamycin B lyase